MNGLREEKQNVVSKHERDFLKMASWYLHGLDVIYEEIETGVPWPDQVGLLLYEADVRCEMSLILKEWRHEKEEAKQSIPCPQTNGG